MGPCLRPPFHKGQTRGRSLALATGGAWSNRRTLTGCRYSKSEIPLAGSLHQSGLVAVRLDEPVRNLAARARQHGHSGGAVRAADGAAIVEPQAHVASAPATMGFTPSHAIPCKVEKIDVAVVVPDRVGSPGRHAHLSAAWRQQEARPRRRLLEFIVAYSHHRVHDFGGRALTARMSFSPNSLSMLCMVPSVAWLCLYPPSHTLLGSNSNPNPNPKTRIGGVCINHRLSRRTHSLHQAYTTPRGFD